MTLQSRMETLISTAHDKCEFCELPVFSQPNSVYDSNGSVSSKVSKNIKNNRNFQMKILKSPKMKLAE